MKMQFIVTFVLLCTAWICAANKTVVLSTPPAQSLNKTEAAKSIQPSTPQLKVKDDAELKEPPLTEEELEALARELEDGNEIEADMRPTKRPRRPQNKYSAPYHHHPQHDPMPFYPAPIPYQYPQCPYAQPQPMYYPMPMYTPSSPFPAYSPNQFYEQNSPPNVMKDEPSDTTEVVNVAELLRIANFWSNNMAKNGTKTNSTHAAKPEKHFSIRKWLKMKAERRATKYSKDKMQAEPAPAA